MLIMHCQDFNYASLKNIKDTNRFLPVYPKPQKEISNERNVKVRKLTNKLIIV